MPKQPATARAEAFVDTDPIAPAHLALARVLEAAGRLADAATAYEAAARSDARGLEARLGAARTLMSLGRVGEAFAHADAALRLDPESAAAWTLIAEGLAASGETEYAAQACGRAVALTQGAADLRVRWGQLLEAALRPFDAAVAYDEALRRPLSSRARVEAHASLSAMHGRAGQFDKARAHATAALALDPDHQGAWQNLAAISDHQGLHEAAEAHRERAYRGRALIVERSQSPRRRVLTLASAGRANSPDRLLIPSSRYDRMLWFLGQDDAPPPDDYDVVFNAVADADAGRALAGRLAAFTQGSRRRVLNAPERIALTTRDAAASLFAETPGLVVPVARRAAVAADTAGLSPGEYLLRPAGTHGGERLERLGLEEAAGRLDGRAHYLTRFYDFRSPDGAYRKYRMFFVDRVAFPYHLAIHDHWLVHYASSQTPGSDRYLDEERRYLENPRAALGETAYGAVVEIGRRLDLDFAGVDFSVLPDGRALLFEANAAMLVHDEAPEGPLAFKNPYVRAILEAFWTRLESA